MDSLIVLHAGAQGIPPQIIKGVIDQETNFLPAMRYEPFEDARLQQGQWGQRMRTNPYWVDSTTGGFPGSPTDHRFRVWGEWRQTYPGYSGSIYDVVASHPNTYPRTAYAFLETEYQREVFMPRLAAVLDSLPDLDSAQARAIATQQAEALWPDYLAGHFRGGLSNYPAQLRIMPSYGFMQLIYFYAVTETPEGPYPEDEQHLPEQIMETDTSLGYSCNHLRSKFRTRHVNQQFSSSTWQTGFEETWRLALIAYNGWFGGNPYGQRVLNRARDYAPR
jgi:hypothetical protein